MKFHIREYKNAEESFKKGNDLGDLFRGIMQSLNELIGSYLFSLHLNLRASFPERLKEYT